MAIGVGSGWWYGVLRNDDGVDVLVPIGVGTGVTIVVVGWLGIFDESRSLDEEMTF